MNANGACKTLEAFFVNRLGYGYKITLNLLWKRQTEHNFYVAFLKILLITEVLLLLPTIWLYFLKRDKHAHLRSLLCVWNFNNRVSHINDFITFSINNILEKKSQRPNRTSIINKASDMFRYNPNFNMHECVLNM